MISPLFHTIYLRRAGPLTFLFGGAQYDRGPPLLKNADPSLVKSNALFSDRRRLLYSGTGANISR